MNKFLGIDYGERKIGLALSSGSVAMPFQIINNNDKTISTLEFLVQIEGISKIILGLPVNSVGKETQATKSVLDFKEQLIKNIHLPIIEFDERLSSRQAQAMGAGSVDDAHAAALVLQSYLDSLDNS